MRDAAEQNRGTRLDLAVMLSKLGPLSLAQGNRQKSLDATSQAVAIARQYSEEFPATARYADLAGIMRARGESLASAGRFEDAAAALTHARDLFLRAAEDAPPYRGEAADADQLARTLMRAAIER